MADADPPPKPPFDEFFRQHFAFVVRLLRHRGLDAGSAQDVAQDVFLVVLRRYEEYDPSRSARSWLWGIARRTESDHHRAQARAQRKHEAAPRPVPSDPEAHHADRQRLAHVEQALQALPQEQREVFVLMDMEGMSAPDVARGCDVPLNTIYSRLRGARQKFSTEFARLRGGER